MSPFAAPSGVRPAPSISTNDSAGGPGHLVAGLSICWIIEPLRVRCRRSSALSSMCGSRATFRRSARRWRCRTTTCGWCWRWRNTWVTTLCAPSPWSRPTASCAVRLSSTPAALSRSDPAAASYPCASVFRTCLPLLAAASSFEVLLCIRAVSSALSLIVAVTQVPVGRETLGRIMNVIGEPVDECGPIRACRSPSSPAMLGNLTHICPGFTGRVVVSQLTCGLRASVPCGRRREAPLGDPPRGAAVCGAVHGSGDPGHWHQGKCSV